MSEKRQGSIPFKELYVYFYGSQFVKHVGGIDTVTRFYTDHSSNLMKNISKKYNMSQKDLEKLERDYNELIQQRLDLIKRLTGTDQKTYKIKGTPENAVMELMIRKLLQKKTTVPDEVVNAIIKNLEYDEAKGAYQYKHGNLFNDRETITMDNKLKVAIGTAEHWRETKSILQRLKNIQAALPLIANSDVIEAYRQQIHECGVSLSKAIAAEKKAKHSGERLHASTIVDEKAKITSIDVANAIYEKMNGMRLTLRSISSINNSLSAYFTELLGHLVAKEGANFTHAEFQKIVEDWVKNGAGTTGAKKDDQQLDLDLGKIEWLDQGSLKSRYSGNNATGIVIKSKIGETYSLRPINSDIANGKTDAEFILETELGKQKKLNISFKTTNLAPELANSEYDSIELQGESTSLLTYLLGAKQNKHNLARYTLNLMAEHPKEENDEYQFDSQMLEAARDKMIETLKLQMLYSALSGAEQGRKGQQANILAIYDKGKSAEDFRVKFYTYDSILAKAAENLDNVKLSYDLSKRFSNTFINPKYGTWAENEPLAKRRTTNIIIDARDTQLSVAIAKNILRRNLKS